MKMAKRKNAKKKITDYKPLIIALIIIILIYLINRLLFLRPIMWLVAVIFISIYLKQFIKMSKKGLVLSIICLFFLSIVVDGIIVTLFKRIPAYTYSVISSDKVNIYYSPGLRIWQCDKNSYKDLIVDQFYNKGYACDVNDIVTIDVNSFLSSVIENYDIAGSLICESVCMTEYNNRLIMYENCTDESERALLESQLVVLNEISIKDIGKKNYWCFNGIMEAYNENC
jgi:energy-coupling factor transporter transmembrane protein EcfT